MTISILDPLVDKLYKKDVAYRNAVFNWYRTSARRLMANKLIVRPSIVV